MTKKRIKSERLKKYTLCSIFHFVLIIPNFYFCRFNQCRLHSNTYLSCHPSCISMSCFLYLSIVEPHPSIDKQDFFMIFAYFQLKQKVLTLKEYLALL